MVPWFHHQRSLHAHRYKTLEAISTVAHHSAGSKYHSNHRPPVLHHGDINHHNKSKDNELARWLHRCFFGLELGPDDMVRCEAWAIQDHDVSNHVCCQSIHELDLHGVWYLHRGSEDVVCRKKWITFVCSNADRSSGEAQERMPERPTKRQRRMKLLPKQRRTETI